MSRIDLLHAVETPEGIDLHAQLAGPVVRILAYAIDLAARTVILIFASSVLMAAERVGLGALLVLSFLLEWFYPVFFEVYWQGQTPGKKALGIAVVHDDLTPVAFAASVIRNLLRSVDFLPFAYLLGLTSMSLSSRFQRLGDLAAGTVVINRGESRAHAEIPDCTPTAPPVPLSLDEQAAMIDFAERHSQLSLERQRELADIVSELTGADGEAGIKRLRGIGAWLVGMR